MTTEQIMMLSGWIMSIILFVVAAVALCKVASVKKELGDKYWTKDVIGKTINSKIGKDQAVAERIQEKILKGEVEEIVTKGVKEFCEVLEKNIDNEPMPGYRNPQTSRLGFSYVDNQKFYVTLHWSLFKVQRDSLPIKFEKDMEASECIQKLIDHYKAKYRRPCGCGPNMGCSDCPPA